MKRESIKRDEENKLLKLYTTKHRKPLGCPFLVSYIKRKVGGNEKKQAPGFHGFNVYVIKRGNSCRTIPKRGIFCLLLNSIQFKNFNHPTRGNFVVVMAGS